jgi:hypothetical protein
LVSHSYGTLQIVKNEEDATTAYNPEAATFLKLHRERLGRDLELYAFMGKIEGDKVLLTRLLEELVLPLRRLHVGGTPSREAFEAGINTLRAMGIRTFEGGTGARWSELLDSLLVDDG